MDKDVPEIPETSESLIVRVQDPSNHEAWDQFEQLYRPVIFRIARARGLQHSDALDLVQQVLMSVAAAIGRYEKLEGPVRFRSWLSRITRNAILKALTKRATSGAVGGTGLLQRLHEVAEVDSETSALIELEYRRKLYVRAAQHVREEVQETTWHAFEMTVVQDVSVTSAARSLGMSEGGVYAARSRVMRRLRDAAHRIAEEIGLKDVEMRS